MSHANILLDSYQIYSGNIIRGKAVCHFNSSKEVRKIRIRLKGEESTHWTGSESYYDSRAKKHRTRTVSYSGNRNFLLSDSIVHGEGIMGPGEHVFHFEFHLSEDIPSTFRHAYGCIRYSITVTVDRPWKIDFESEKEFTVISPLRIQQVPSHLLEPVAFSDEKTVGCFCCASGLIQLDTTLEKRAFVIGENAAIKLRCLNMSNTNVESLAADIKLKLTFKTISSSTQYKHDSVMIASSYNSGVGAHGEKTFNPRLEIPQSTVVPNFTGCELFKCESRLKVTAVISGCHTNLDISTNVALAHVPLPQIPSSIAPPYQINNIQPMFMPMPLPGYEAVGDKAVGIPPYPVPTHSPGPSAPQQLEAASAPLKWDVAGNYGNTGAGNVSSGELPPSYEEAAKNKY